MLALLATFYCGKLCVRSRQALSWAHPMSSSLFNNQRRRAFAQSPPSHTPAPQALMTYSVFYKTTATVAVLSADRSVCYKMRIFAALVELASNRMLRCVRSASCRLVALTAPCVTHSDRSCPYGNLAVRCCCTYFCCCRRLCRSTINNSRTQVNEINKIIIIK